MKKTFKKLFAFLLVCVMLCGCAVNASAVSIGDGDISDIIISNGTYNNAVATMRGIWDGIAMNVETSAGDQYEAYTVIYDGNGNSMVTFDPSGLDSSCIYYADVNSEDVVAIIYIEDEPTLENGWYSFGSDTFEFYMLYTPIVDFAFLDTSFDDSCFNITKDGDTTVLTATAACCNAIGYAFFGDFSDETTTDEYTSVVIKIKNGVISSLTASNEYSTPEGSLNYEYTVTFEESDFTMVEYKKYISLYEIPADAAELPVGETVQIGGDTYFVYTPEKTTSIRFAATDDDGNNDPYMDIYKKYDDASMEYITVLDDKGNELCFNEYFSLVGGKTYYFYVGDYNEEGGFSFTVEELVFLGKDINGDGRVSPLDASLILQYNAGLYAFTDEQVAAADANGDGKVTPLDASLFLQYDAKLIVGVND